MAKNDERRNEEFESYFEAERRTRVITRWILAVSLVVSAVAASAFMKIGSGSIVEAETDRKVAVERTNELQVLNEAAQTQVLTLTKRVEELEEDPNRPALEPDRSVEEMLLVQLEDSRQEVAAWAERYESLQSSIEGSTVNEELLAQINALSRDLAQCEKDRDTALAKERQLITQISRLRSVFDSQNRNIRRLERDLAICKIERDAALTQEKVLRSLIKEVFDTVVTDIDRSEFIAKINSRLFKRLKDAAEGD